jgi:CRP/FNR family transcriptional regulator, cyclic AMP receptor protein
MHESEIPLSPLFQSVPRRRRGEVAQATDRLVIRAGSTVIRQGELAHEFFVILDGTATVIRDGRSVGVLRTGDFFGEIALVGQPYRTATVVADTDLDVLVMSRRAFRTILSRFPDFASTVLQAGRIRVVSTLRQVEADA